MAADASRIFSSASGLPSAAARTTQRWRYSSLLLMKSRCGWATGGSRLVLTPLPEGADPRLRMTSSLTGGPFGSPGRRELVHSILRSLWVLTRERRLVNRPRRPRECRQISAQRFPSTVRGRHRSWSGPFRGRWSAIVPRRPPACAQVACVSPTGDLRLCTGAVDNGLPGRRRAAYVVPWSFRGQRLRQKCQRCNLRSGRDGWEAARRRRPPGGDVPAERE